MPVLNPIHFDLLHQADFAITCFSHTEATGNNNGNSREAQPSRTNPVRVHYSAHYPADKVHPLYDLKKLTASCESVCTFPHLDHVGMLLVLKCDGENVFFLLKMTSVQKALINAVITITVGNSKRKKRRDHAPTHGQFPCPAFGPHDASVSASDSLDFFFLVYLSSFLFFLSSFSLTFSIRTLYLSSIVSLYTFAHAHIVTLESSKCQKKFGATFTWTRRGLITR